MLTNLQCSICKLCYKWVNEKLHFDDDLVLEEHQFNKVQWIYLSDINAV
ncbi:hypothetical protein [Acinetobacter rudis]|nr:hypothetical protein [Acinetobacter rudis]